MRNEELETRLQDWMMKCWEIKQINIQQQGLMKALLHEREEYKKFFQKAKKDADSSYSFCKYECNRYDRVIKHEKVIPTAIENMRTTINRVVEL